MNFVKCSLCLNDSKLIVASKGLLSLIERFLAIRLPENSNEPNLICGECCSKIDEFHKFRRKVRKLFKDSVSDEQECESANEGDVSIPNPVENETDVQPTIKVEDETDVQPTIKEEPIEYITFEDSSHETDEQKADILAAERSLLCRDNRVCQDEISPRILNYCSIDMQTASCKQDPKDDNIPNFSKSSNVTTETSPFTQHLKNEASEEKQNQVNIGQKKHPSTKIQQFLKVIREKCNISKEKRICSLCFTICDSMKSLHDHRRREHQKDGNKETSYGTDLSELRMHEKLKHCRKRSRIKSETCDKIFENSLEKQHQCGYKQYNCFNLCGDRFETEKQLLIHLRNCPCEKVYSSSPQSLKFHEQKCMNTNVPTLKVSAVSNKPEEVNKTTASTATNASSTTVINTTISSQPKMDWAFKCLKCNSRFETVSALEHHFIKCRGDYADAIRCLTCKKSFISQKSLQIHQVTSHGHHVENLPQDELEPNEDNENSIDELNKIPDHGIKIKIESEMIEEFETEPQGLVGLKKEFHDELIIENKNNENESERNFITRGAENEFIGENELGTDFTTQGAENEFIFQTTENNITQTVEEGEPTTYFRTTDSLGVFTNEAQSNPRCNLNRGRWRNTRGRWSYPRNNPSPYKYYRRGRAPRKFVWSVSTGPFSWLPKNEFRF